MDGTAAGQAGGAANAIAPGRIAACKGTLACVVFARDYTTTKNAKSTKERIHLEIFFFESNDPFFVVFVRFVVKSISALIYETLHYCLLPKCL